MLKNGLRVDLHVSIHIYSPGYARLLSLNGQISLKRRLFPIFYHNFAPLAPPRGHPGVIIFSRNSSGEMTRGAPLRPFRQGK